ncbi:alpha/beta hydrolase [Gordonia sp. DT30]|uniref:alpha/beta hydrolase n=1 Tax=unclassified Gordonia (in: high G+C Gram-positive bacteria) TaxID=2657482 RepID=UPI003CF0F81D
MHIERACGPRSRVARSWSRAAYALVVASMVIGLTACAGGQRASAPAAVPAPPQGVEVARIDYPVPAGKADPTQNWMDLYLPTHRPGRLPLVVLIHGGAWRNRISAASFAVFAATVADRGVAVLNVEYRRVGSGGGWSTTFSDVAAAINDIPAVANRYPVIDAQRSVVVGHSAGAQLAVWSATRDHRTADAIGVPVRYRPALAFSISGPLDMRRAAALGDRNVVQVLGGSPGQVPRRYAAVDPFQNLDPQVPVIAVIGSRDTTVPAILTQDYVAADNAAGGHARLMVFAGQTHSSIVSPTSTTFPRLVDEIVKAVRGLRGHNADQ